MVNATITAPTKPKSVNKPNAKSQSNVKIISRDQHNISRKLISENALKVLYRLNNQGYEAYLVGGCVRDLLLGRKPKDFDITTNATPEQVQKTFRNCRLVGKRFRLAHIMFGREIIEVATFRGEHNEDDSESSSNKANESKRSQSGMLLRDNVYGTLEQDAMRRDFTINSLYYSVKDFTIRDYCNGIKDLNDGVIRLIGDPQTRYREDPVRMLRAVRFAAKLNMRIATDAATPIKKLAPLLKNIPGPRLFDESLKLLQSGYGYQTYLLLREHHLFELLFPTLSVSLAEQQTSSHKYQSNAEKMVEQVLKNTDYRILNKQRINPAFLFAAFLWYPLSEHTQELIIESGLSYQDAFALAINNILSEQCSVMSIPKRLTLVMGEIWRLQLRMNKRNGKRAYAIFEHQKFRAAYDLLELRSSIEKGELLTLTKWWDEFQHSDENVRELMIKQVIQQPRERKIKNTTRRKTYNRTPPKKVNSDC